MITTRNAVNLATAAAMVAIAGSPVVAFAKHHKEAAKPAAAGEQVVHCYGINTCKGTSDCKTASNECKGQNECKGMGFKALTTKACSAAGGSLTEKAS
jgi:hypothetical protein